MNTMRDIINLLNEAKPFQASDVKTSRTKLAETRNVKRSTFARTKLKEDDEPTQAEQSDVTTKTASDEPSYQEATPTEYTQKTLDEDDGIGTSGGSDAANASTYESVRMKGVRELINIVNEGMSEEFLKASVLKKFRAKLKETRNVKRSSIATAKYHGIDVRDVAFIVREAKEKVMEDDSGDDYKPFMTPGSTTGAGYGKGAQPSNNDAPKNESVRESVIRTFCSNLSKASNNTTCALRTAHALSMEFSDVIAIIKEAKAARKKGIDEDDLPNVVTPSSSSSSDEHVISMPSSPTSTSSSLSSDSSSPNLSSDSLPTMLAMAPA